MTTNTNTLRIDIDVNPESGKTVNHDLMSEIAARAFDWRLFVYDPDGDDEVLANMYDTIESRLRDQSDAIATATGIPADEIIITRDNLDALDFIWVIEYESRYEGTTSTYQSVVMISYVITEDYSHE